MTRNTFFSLYTNSMVFLAVKSGKTFHTQDSSGDYVFDHSGSAKKSLADLLINVREYGDNGDGSHGAADRNAPQAQCQPPSIRPNLSGQ